MTINISHYLLVFIIILSMIFGGVSLTYSNLKMILLPAIVSGLIFVLAVVELTWELLANKRAAGKNRPKAEGSSIENINEEVGLERVDDDIRGDMVGFAWLIGMIIATYLLGFLISIPLFILIYLMTHGVNWLKSAIMAAAAVILIFLIFVKVMQVDLFPGIIIELFM